MASHPPLSSRVANLLPKGPYLAYLFAGYEDIRRDLYLDPEALKRLQARRLERFLAKAARLPFYRSFGADPRDLASFPVIDKAMILDRTRELQAGTLLPTLSVSTSGSTGVPLRFTRSFGDGRKEWHYVLRSFDRYGFRPGDLMGALRSYIPSGPDQDTLWFQARKNILWMSAYHMDQANLQRYVEALRKDRVRFLLAYPSSAYLLAQYCLERGLELPDLRACFLSSEKMVREWKTTLDRAFPAMEVIDRYGTAEFSHSFTLCSTCGGYHIHEDYSHTELLPVPGDPERFELVGTGFLNSAFPLVRYNMKDVFRLDEARPSRCAYGSRVLAGEIEGRTSDLIHVEGKWLPGVNFYTLFYDFEQEIRQFQLIQTDLDRVQVNLVKKPGAGRDLEARLEAQLRRRLGIAVGLAFSDLDEIPRDPKSGKHKNIISRIART